ncbi:hypothetical protein DPMN_119718 [Dreissena polymorpha]|uniref:Uncharacterized protein n=1 Tax=Dreissena polymorpha TaxID=45954 RepID=A0A9D4JS63_DREPO|nr:hypothetical protein DPMN_119718 [Dreissena polymorpha]
MTDQGMEWLPGQDIVCSRHVIYTRTGKASRTGNCMTDQGMEWLPGQGIVWQNRAWSGYQDRDLYDT